MDGWRGSVGISTRAWHQERSSRVRPCFSGPKTRAMRPPDASFGARTAVRSGSEITGCSGLRWVRVPVPATKVQSATASARVARLSGVEEQFGRANGGARLAPVGCVGRDNREVSRARSWPWRAPPRRCSEDCAARRGPLRPVGMEWARHDCSACLSTPKLLNSDHLWSPIRSTSRRKRKRCVPRRDGAMRAAGFRRPAATSACATGARRAC